ncbi:hypothetical protein M066_2031 [Bacteroides fragilis str. I1345]|uniref:Uncharacterized protein n=1 Tax=Bacteroides fragilis str. 3998T(B)3 TaxID=1339316 RepID=A0A015XDW0_BACFG|nr:hypothetical protein M125_2441 [Bacteroides fragilis str. 3998T(B)3]EXY95748.1 hypothetical protein M081_2100 [Bacteroides fragilis str. 3998 T(B) 4]EYA28037.1 hypothetical protein M106_2901 [Bacteroides fragilis str. 1009-4-F \
MAILRLNRMQYALMKLIFKGGFVVFDLKITDPFWGMDVIPHL